MDAEKTGPRPLRSPPSPTPQRQISMKGTFSPLLGGAAQQHGRSHPLPLLHPQFIVMVSQGHHVIIAPEIHSILSFFQPKAARRTESAALFLLPFLLAGSGTNKYSTQQSSCAVVVVATKSHTSSSSTVPHFISPPGHVPLRCISAKTREGARCDSLSASLFVPGEAQYAYYSTSFAQGVLLDVL